MRSVAVSQFVCTQHFVDSVEVSGNGLGNSSKSPFPQLALFVKESQRPASALMVSAVQALENIGPTQLSVSVLNPPPSC